MPDEVRPQDAWLEDRYASFYRKHPPGLPDRFARREFGFLFHGQKFFLRHLRFPTERDFREFLFRRGPAHSYYSTAYYKEPDARTMAEKGWLGAELIFDLDADHVPGAEKLPHREQLEKVKFHFLRLVEDFIMRDFGFAERDLVLTFSGGRGYHCHVMHPKALALSSQERREIVDYVTGTGLDHSRFMVEETLRSRNYGGKNFPEKSPRIPPKDAPGWGRRYNAVAVEYVRELQGASEEAFAERFKGLGKMGPKRLSALRDEVLRLTPAQLEQGFIDSGNALARTLPGLLEQKIIPLAKGETDEPVTSDTKRLIRLPGSLHGKSGLKVVTLRLDEVRGFDPLTDAVAFGAEPVRIKVENPSKVDVAGFKADLGAGETTVPEAAAVMLVARGVAAPVL